MNAARAASLFIAFCFACQTAEALAQEAKPANVFKAPLPAAEASKRLTFDNEQFQKLQKAYPSASLTNEQLITLGKGWLAKPSSQAETGVQILKRLGESGSVDANMTLGLRAKDPPLRRLIGDPSPYFERAARAGDPSAAQALGRLLSDPDSPKYNPVAGSAWLQKSVAAGDVSANADLAVAYEFGNGVKVDLGKSADLLRQGAARSNALKLPYAAFLLRNGAPASDPAVVKLIGDAAQGGDPYAQVIAAQSALAGQTSVAAKALALSQLTVVAKGTGAPSIAAKIALGKAALTGSTSPETLKYAETLFQAAANTGNPEGKAQLGKLYVEQFAKDPIKAADGLKLLNTQAAVGNPTAIVALASPAVSPRLDAEARATQALTGWELGASKEDFAADMRAACDPRTAQAQCNPVPVFYLTNRKAVPGPDGETYSNAVDLDGALKAGVSMAYAPVAATPAPGGPPSGWTIFWQGVRSAPGIGSLVHLWSSDAGNAKPSADFALHNVRSREDLAAFVKALHNFGAGAGRPKAFVYIHGFANSFDSAVVRLAFLSQQYNFPGVPIVLDWASADTPFVQLASLTTGDAGLGYLTDATRVRQSCADFQNALGLLADEFGPGNVMVLAHSMGGLLASDMLTGCEGGGVWKEGRKLGALVFAAPDVATTDFAKAEKTISQYAAPIVLYASQNDIALAISSRLEDTTVRRLGQGGSGIFVQPPLQSIDASQVENLPSGSAINHSYVFDVKQVRQDLVAVLRGVPLNMRDCITGADGKKDPPGAQVGADPTRYWVVQADCQ